MINGQGPCQSDPTHSFLSKDHFVCPALPVLIVRLMGRLQTDILNQPAGNVAKIIVVWNLVLPS